MASSWKTIDALPVARWRCSADSFRNFVYIAGGCSDSAQATPVLSVLKSRINALDDGNGPWLACAPVMADGKIGAQVFVMGPSEEIAGETVGNGFLVILGGRGALLTGAGQKTAQDVYVGKIDSDGNVPAWNKLAGIIPVPMVDPAIAVFNSWLYLIGGSTVTITLPFNTQTVNFTIGDTITGGTSAATGKLVSQVDAGATGTLTLSNVVGLFQNNETITDQHSGSAKAGGAQVVTEVASTAIYRARIDTNGAIEPFQLLPAILPAALSPASTSVIHGHDKLLISSGSTLYMARLQPGGDISAFKTSALPASKVAHAMWRFGNNDLVLFGGDTAGDKAHATASVYTAVIDQDGVVSGKWYQTDPMPSAKEYFGSAILRDRIFLVGGINSGGTVQTEVSVARIDGSGAIGSKY